MNIFANIGKKATINGFWLKFKLITDKDKKRLKTHILMIQPFLFFYFILFNMLISALVRNLQ